MYDFHVFTIFNTELTLLIDSSLLRFITNQHNDQLPVGLLIQLIEQCTGIAEVMSSNPIQYSVVIIYCEDHFHVQAHALL